MRSAMLFVPVIFVFLVSCGGGPTGEQSIDMPKMADKRVIYTVNYPLAYFAERIGDDLVDVHFPAPKNGDPAYWKPDAETVTAYQRADLILLNGAGYAKWTELAALPPSRIVNTSEAIGDRLLPLEGTVTHSHGPEGEHEHGGYAFTTWLDPDIATQQALAIATALALLRPEHEEVIHRRLDELEGDLVDLDSRLASIAERLDDEPLLFSHPVYQYLIDRFGLNGVEVHWEPDEAPDGHAWDHLEELLETHPARWMVWEGQPLAKTVADLETRGIESVVFDPCGNRPEDGDFLTAMAANTASLEAIANSIE